MYAGRRIATLRVTALAALAVSAILCADGLHPGRAFCPMAAACDKARSSALGRIFGIPTSVVGMAAFGGLFALSMLRVEHSRRLLRPAGFLAALVGAGLFAYQALVLHSFCPLCLVADTAGLVSGLIVLTWPRTPVRRSGRKLDPESTVAKLRWLAVAFAAASGLEDRMFDELVRADDETPQEVYAAAQRAGVDATALQAALASARAWPRLDGDRRLAQGARLEGLPTLDIGRRRLMGEQSEGELREALRAATARPEPAR